MVTGTLSPAELDLLVRRNKRTGLKATIRKRQPVLLPPYGIYRRLRRPASVFVYAGTTMRTKNWRATAVGFLVS